MCAWAHTHAHAFSRRRRPNQEKGRTRREGAVRGSCAWGSRRVRLHSCRSDSGCLGLGPVSQPAVAVGIV
eukprot:2883692-Prymnesium_polylepis.3